MLSSDSEFNLLAQKINWRKDSIRYRKERAKFLASEFNIHYGSNAKKLENWQALCVELDTSDSIRRISQCRRVSYSSMILFLFLLLLYIIVSGT